MDEKPPFPDAEQTQVVVVEPELEPVDDDDPDVDLTPVNPRTPPQLRPFLFQKGAKAGPGRPKAAWRKRRARSIVDKVLLADDPRHHAHLSRLETRILYLMDDPDRDGLRKTVDMLLKYSPTARAQVGLIERPDGTRAMIGPAGVGAGEGADSGLEATMMRLWGIREAAADEKRREVMEADPYGDDPGMVLEAEVLPSVPDDDAST